MMHVAIVGCGQLARMMAHAGQELTVSFSFLANPGEDTRCVEGLGTVVELPADPEPAELYAALGEPSVITVEREAVDIGLLQTLKDHCPVYPDPDIIAFTKNRHREKQALQALDIPVAPYRAGTGFAEIQTAIQAIGYPAFVKSCEQGYDGKNQWRVKSADDIPALKDAVADQHCVVERGIDFLKEASIIAARSSEGEVAFYPLTENVHRHGILYCSRAPALDINSEHTAQARDYVKRMLESWDYVGVLGVEFFVTREGFLVNEIAPRVHNSGHWTMNAGISSQFENHIRAILGMSLGPTVAEDYAGMVNLLGTTEAPEEALKKTHSKVHLYNKETRPGRKMGHINLTNTDPDELTENLNALSQTVYGVACF